MSSEGGREGKANQECRLFLASHRPASGNPILLETRASHCGSIPDLGIDQDGDRAVIDEGDLHERAELAGLDAPSKGLAPKVIREIFDHIARLRAERGMTILLVEQNARGALAIADRGYVLETGRVVLEGTSEDLLANQDVQRAYLGRERNDNG